MGCWNRWPRMQATLWSCVWGGLGALILSILSLALAEDCVIPKVFPHFATNDMQEVETNLCYKCYHAPNSLKFQVKLNEVKLGGISSMMIYVDGVRRHITHDCGICDSLDVKSGTVNSIKSEGMSDKVVCQECESVKTGTMFEIYLRYNTQIGPSSEGESICQNIADFNISLIMDADKPEIEAPSDCDEGFMVSYPLGGETCIINSTFLGTETHCLVPTCSNGIISSDEMSEKIEHKFQPFMPSEACVWQLNTEQHKHVTLRFSKNIRPHITIFEESLMNPKWDVEWCPTYDDHFSLVTDADTVFIVYHSSTKLTKKGSLSISTQTDLCLLPPSLENGSVEFKRLESGTVALYMCDKDFSLLGPIELYCDNGAWDEPPVCLRLNKPILIFPDESVPEESSKDNNKGSVKEPVDVADVPLIEEEFHMNKPVTSLETYGNDSTDLFLVNSTDSSGKDLVDGDTEEGGIFAGLFNFDLEDDMTLYIIIGAIGLAGLVIVSIISLVVYRKRYPVRLGLGRKFDTFQNPIYEKTVVRMPMHAEEMEEERKKSDAEEMSDCTVLE
ncbi:uncharacterized protein [Procambarus clarkii]|uniref:uncharacterized protein isoform X2 n=1 Tax=Procambarus clarkii TaxID=6728 RepID=UPI001E671820|nr:uncharacterized protein LOC123769885 isoform X2 [Procambarus clarkii]